MSFRFLLSVSLHTSDNMVTTRKVLLRGNKYLNQMLQAECLAYLVLKPYFKLCHAMQTSLFSRYLFAYFIMPLLLLRLSLILYDSGLKLTVQNCDISSFSMNYLLNDCFSLLIKLAFIRLKLESRYDRVYYIVRSTDVIQYIPTIESVMCQA